LLKGKIGGQAMLVLTRKSGQGIWVSEDIRIVVVDIREGQVKLGIDAPRETPIYRDEIYEKVRMANVSAVRLGADEFDWIRERFTS